MAGFDIDALGADGRDDDLHDAEDRKHDEHADDAPEHLLAALGPLFFIVGILHIDKHPIDEVRESQSENKYDCRIDDDGVDLRDQIADIGISNINEAWKIHQAISSTGRY